MTESTNKLAQEIADKKNQEEKKLGLSANWTIEDVLYVAAKNMHDRVFSK